VFDYHLHLWPHDESASPCSIEQVAAYCEQARRRGVAQIALTEHLFRFRQGIEAVGSFWEDAGAPALRSSMSGYVAHHCHADLDDYVELVGRARSEGLDVLLGLEVDYYPGRMASVAGLLDDYPFDLVLGSVHWLDAWRFDHLEDPLQMAEWEARAVDACWDAYTEAIEELSATGVVDVLAHPDLIKVAGHVPEAPEEWWDRIVEAASAANVAAELSSAGWRKPIASAYPAPGLLERLVAAGVPLTTASDAHHGATVGERIDELCELARGAGATTLVRFEGRRRSEVEL
jgi:histidinol-phosphatase (PHP family)